MLTNKILSYYNRLLATGILYFTIVEPLQDLATILNHNTDSGYQYARQLALASSEPEKDYYEVLGVPKDADKHSIHKAFRILAKRYHPDRNKDEGAQEEFIKAFKAYETLSDEKKRKEYDNRSKMSGHSSWQAGNMQDFDINDFFKQYEDQMLKHSQHFAQHHNQHNHNHYGHHQRFHFHGVDLDDLLHDIDPDEFGFGGLFDHEHANNFDGNYGDGASYFGSHFHHSQIHDTLNHYHQNQHVYSSGHSQGGYFCQTIKKQVNGMLMTQTSCG